MKLVTAEEMREIEEFAFEKLKIPSIILMEHAAMELFSRIKIILKKVKKPKITVIIGPGNNGGDGFCLCRLLYSEEIIPNIIFVGDETKIKNDALINFNIVKNLKLKYYSIGKKIPKEVEDIIFNSDLIVDSLFGIGLIRNIEGIYKEIIEIMNESNKKIISVDIPSGINSDTGQVMGVAVKAFETVTFGCVKKGLILYPGFLYAKKITLANISLPKDMDSHIKTETYTEIKKYLPKRKIRSNKGTYGKVFVFSGSRDMTGAAFLVSKAAYKAGAGLVYGMFIKPVKENTEKLLPEAVYKTIKDEDGFYCKKSSEGIENDLDKASVIIIGPGMGNNSKTKDFFESVLENARVAMVIDADALNILAENNRLWGKIKVPAIITPHPMEMSRLSGISVEEILNNPIEISLRFAKEKNVVVLLKDSRTIISSPDGRVYINSSGSNSMSKGGSGDVLTGIIGGFVAQGLDVFEAGKIGAYLHGKAGEQAAGRFSEYGVLASELIESMTEILQ